MSADKQTWQVDEIWNMVTDSSALSCKPVHSRLYQGPIAYQQVNLPNVKFRNWANIHNCIANLHFGNKTKGS